MKRVWRETISPKWMHDTLGIFNGYWMPQMDRCWISDDGYEVMSRLLRTEWGKVEHVTISYVGDEDLSFSFNGERDIHWAVKQEIKNELFGENRVAIEVFPEEKSKIDAQDIYHLWVMPKGFKLPFGIHVKRDKQCEVINRGCPKDITRLAYGSAEIRGIK